MDCHHEAGQLSSQCDSLVHDMCDSDAIQSRCCRGSPPLPPPFPHSVTQQPPESQLPKFTLDDDDEEEEGEEEAPLPYQPSAAGSPLAASPTEGSPAPAAAAAASSADQTAPAAASAAGAAAPAGGDGAPAAPLSEADEAAQAVKRLVEVCDQPDQSGESLSEPPQSKT